MRSRLLVLGVLAVLIGTLVAFVVFLPPAAPTASRSPAPSASATPGGSTTPPAPSGVAYRDFSFETPTVTSVPDIRAQARAWYAHDRWWAGMIEPANGRLDIFQLDPASQEWLDTGELVDGRRGANADFLWSGEHLYVVSSGTRASASNEARLSRFSFDAAAGRFAIDADFPIPLVPLGIGAPVIAEDGAGTLWVTYVADGRVWLLHSLEHDAAWSEPVALTVGGGAVGVDDLASLVPFGPGRLGLMWSNQLEQSVQFSVHEDGAPADAWSTPEIVLAGIGGAHDRLVPRSFALADGSGSGVLAALRTSLEDRQPRNGLDPGLVLAVRTADGTWATHLISQVRDDLGGAVAMVDDATRTVYVAMSSPANGGAIFYKRSPIDAPAFDTGAGIPLLASSQDTKVKDATTAKGNLSPEAGLLMLASDDDTKRYLHAVMDLGGGAPTADPADPARLEQPAPPDPANPLVYLHDTFQPWPAGPAAMTGWTGDSEGTPVALKLVDDGPKDRALRVPAARAGVRACHDVPEIAGTTVLVRARVRLSRAGAADATILSVRGSGGETGSVRVTDDGVLAWFDRATKIQTLTPFRPRIWYRVVVRVNQPKKTYDVRVTTDGGRVIASVAGLRWRSAAVPVVRSVCFSTAVAPPSQIIDVSEVSMIQELPR